MEFIYLHGKCGIFHSFLSKMMFIPQRAVNHHAGNDKYLNPLKPFHFALAHIYVGGNSIFQRRENNAHLSNYQLTGDNVRGVCEEDNKLRYLRKLEWK